MNFLEQMFFINLNAPYIWGAKNPLVGFDCSGLVEWCLESVGFVIPGTNNAQSLHDFFMNPDNGKPCDPQAGALIFFGENTKSITHIGWMKNSLLMYEAGGGDSTCTSKDTAAKKGACTRLRPYTRRKDAVAFLMPNYPEWLKHSV